MDNLDPKIDNAEKQDNFSQYCPDPVWLDLTAPIGCSHSEMQSIYAATRHDRNSIEQLPSSGFLSMKSCSKQPEVALYGLMLVAQRKEYPQLFSCANHFIDKLFYFRSQSVPDTSYHVSGAIGQVAQALIADNNSEGAAYLLSRLYCERGEELPSYVAQGSGYYFVLALSKIGRQEHALMVARDLVNRYETPEERRFQSLIEDLEEGP